MRKLATFISVFALAVALGLAGTSSSMAAGKGPKVSGVVSQFSGTYVQFGLGAAGDLVTCPGSEALAISTTTFYFLDNICDDAGSSGLLACAGRYTALIEECSDPARDIKLDGNLLSVLSRGQLRICFDTDAAGNCTTSLATNEIVIGTGTTLTQTRLDLFTAPASATTENTLTSSTTFPADGRDLKLAGAAFSQTISHVTAQPNTSPPDCGGTGCGLAGVSVTTH